ncbi:MAG: serine/threonine-protein kinase [Myxococcales bacterium]
MPNPTTATAQEPFPRGSVIGDKYRIDGVLGAGGMGVVLSATHLELDAPVAIKVLRGELAKNGELASQLLFEARAVARLRSAHVVRIIDVARLPSGAPYIVMEQLRGSNLASLIDEHGALSVDDAVAYLRQACEGLREAHALGIVHRDLKPENLFLARTPEGAVLKILDFGISKYVGGVGGALRRAPRSTLTRTGNAVGSPFYMAPEQMRAAPDLDARADIWSLGAILYELLTARCPFEADSPAALCAKVMAEDAPSLRAFSESIPEQLDAILHRCLEKEPSARYQSVAELADALSDFATTEAALSARHASGVELRLEPESPSSGRGTLIALGGVCLMLVGAGVAFWQLQFRDTARPSLSASTFATEVSPSRPLPPLPAAEPEPTGEIARRTKPPAAGVAPMRWPKPVPPAEPIAHEPPAVSAVATLEVAPAPSAADVARTAQPVPTPASAPAPAALSARAPSDPALRYGL